MSDYVGIFRFRSVLEKAFRTSAKAPVDVHDMGAAWVRLDDSAKGAHG